MDPHVDAVFDSRHQQAQVASPCKSFSSKKSRGGLFRKKKSLDMGETPMLKIIHFNDVYDIDPKKQGMGVVNFKAKVEQLRNQHPQALLLFSGDAFSPSLLSNIKHGWQMVHCLNSLRIDCACYGNHEFDFKREHTLKLAHACNFPWLLGNIHYKEGGLLGNGRPYLVKEVDNLKIGIMGVAGDDWIGILTDEYEDILVYESYLTFVERTAKLLREELKCDIVIGLTHMRNDADRNLAAKLTCLDIILGGHDHVIMNEFINGTPVIKSGSNFSHVRLIQMFAKNPARENDGNRFSYEWELMRVPEAELYDGDLKSYVDVLQEKASSFNPVVGFTSVELETRFTSIRVREGNYGNFLTDLIRIYYDCEGVIINSGTIRNDLLIPEGYLNYAMLSNIINSPIIIKKVSGDRLVQALEHAVKSAPEFSGSFLMVAGMTYEYDWRAAPRIGRVTIKGQPVEKEKFYSVAMTSYIGRGGDGFDMLRACDFLLDEVKAITLLALLLKFFKFEGNDDEDDASSCDSSSSYEGEDHETRLNRKASTRLKRIDAFGKGQFQNPDSGDIFVMIAPVLDGRIKCTTIL